MVIYIFHLLQHKDLLEKVNKCSYPSFVFIVGFSDGFLNCHNKQFDAA